ncbi:MAG: cytochrome c family protein, partial [Chromatiales bacterium]|nr:cytochrome c family protein [Chromatiales bacterium]
MQLNLTITRPVFRILVVTTISIAAFVLLTLFLPWKKNTGVDVAKDLTNYSMPWTNNSPFYPSEWKIEGDKLIDWRGVPSATFCAECHEKEYKQWASSIHAITGPDVIYENAITVNELGSKHGGELATEKVRWCDGCHEPLGILAGEGTPLPVVGPNEALEEGATCILCHTAVESQPLIGNGALTLKFN